MNQATQSKFVLAMMVVSLGVSPALATADILTLRADTKLGGAAGKGMFGERKDVGFYEGGARPSYGLILGAEVFFVDAWIEHNQFLQSGDVNGTWTQFMLGIDVEIEIGETKAADVNAAGKSSGGYSAWMAELGMGAGFGVGTGQQVDPPLDNSEVTDKGFLLEARGMVAYRLTEMFSLGVTVPVQFGYFTKSGSGTFANNVDNHYAGMSGSAMLTFRAALKLK